MMGRLFYNWGLTIAQLLLLIILIHPITAQEGFVSLACCANTNFIDKNTSIEWTQDSQWLFPNYSSTCANINNNNKNNEKSRIFGSTVLGVKRYCYHFNTIKGEEYLIRGTFLVNESSSGSNGDYSSSLFGVYIGKTLLSRVKSFRDSVVIEGSFKAERKYIDFCLEKDDEGDEAYISYLELRQLRNFSYLSRFPSCVFKLIARLNVGESTLDIRYFISFYYIDNRAFYPFVVHFNHMKNFKIFKKPKNLSCEKLCLYNRVSSYKKDGLTQK